MDGLVLVFDTTNNDSFIGINNWIQIIKEECVDEKPMFLIGNKTDLENIRQVGKNEASSYHINYYETSALKGTGLKEAFIGICKELLEKKQEEQEKAKHCCCHC